MHDAVAELGVVRDLAQAGARVAELAEGLQRRLGELVAALVVLVGGRARAVAAPGGCADGSFAAVLVLAMRHTLVDEGPTGRLDSCPESS